MGALPVQEMRRLLEGAQGSLTSLSIQGWTPVLERNRGRFQHFYDARSVFAAFDCASEITELEWRQISLPLSLTLRITCCFRNLVTLRLGISAEDSGDERNFFQLHALQMLPNLKELRIVEDQDFFGHVYCPLTCLGLALAPLRNLVILDMGEVPVWKDTDAIPSLLIMLEQLKYLMELRTLMFCPAELWDQLEPNFGCLPRLHRLCLHFSEPSSEDIASFVKAIGDGLFPALQELELVMINMEDDSGMGVDEDDWDDWLLGALSRLKKGPKLKCILLDSCDLPCDLDLLENNLAAGGVQLAFA